MTHDDKVFFLEWARTVIVSYFAGLKEIRPSRSPGDPSGAFVTLHKTGDLRGCIGYLYADDQPLIETIRQASLAAAFRDYRFPPVEKDEMKKIDIEISILTPFDPVKNILDIKIGKHGLLLKKGSRSGLLLPQVPIEQGWDRDTFLDHLCLKAGLPPGSWEDKSAELLSFSAEVFGEKELGLFPVKD